MSTSEQEDKINLLLGKLGQELSDRERQAATLSSQYRKLEAMYENRSHEPDMSASDAYHYCTELLDPHVREDGCNENGLAATVCGSLSYLIHEWEGRKSRDARVAREAFERYALEFPAGSESAKKALSEAGKYRNREIALLEGVNSSSLHVTA